MEGLGDFIDTISNDKESMRIFVSQVGKYFSKPVSRPIYVENVGGILKFFKPKKKKGLKMLFSLNPHNTTLTEHGWMLDVENRWGQNEPSIISEEIKIFIRDNNIRKLLSD